MSHLIGHDEFGSTALDFKVEIKSKCIFCKKQIDGSDEHVIPESLNGKLHSKTLICKKCNQKFGGKLDPILKETLFMQLHLLGFENAKSFRVRIMPANDTRLIIKAPSIQ